MLATGQVYRDPDTDYEALMVKRNAPRWIAMLKKHGLDPATRSTTTPGRRLITAPGGLHCPENSRRAVAYA